MPLLPRKTTPNRTDSVQGYVNIDLSSGDVSFPIGYIRSVYVGNTGTLMVVGPDDTDPVALVGLASGVFHPCEVIRFVATGTTCTGIVGGR